MVDGADPGVFNVKAFGFEQVCAQPVERRRRAPRGERVEARGPLVDMETGVGLRGDAERGDIERHVVGRAVDRRDELLERVHRERR